MCEIGVLVNDDIKKIQGIRTHLHCKGKLKLLNTDYASEFRFEGSKPKKISTFIREAYFNYMMTG